VRNVRLVGSLVTAASDLQAIVAAIRAVRSAALDLELYGPHKGDWIDPWAVNIRLIYLCVCEEAAWPIEL
jgi:hypothetical protein